MRFSIYQDSLIGARPTNQDRMGYCFTRDSLLMLVADGMGGHQKGDLAAQITLKILAAHFQSQAKPLLPDPSLFFDTAIRLAHRELLHYQCAHFLHEAPRTTVVACVVQKNQVWWAHVGDSRLYWFRNAEVKSRTRDHSRVQQLVDLGQVDPKDVAFHPERNRVLNCLGSALDPVIEVGGPGCLQEGDTLFLCSDGVWSCLQEEELVSHLSGAPAQKVSRVVAQAVERGGLQADNATAVAMTWEGQGEIRLSELGTSDSFPDQAMTTTVSVNTSLEEGCASFPARSSKTSASVPEEVHAISNALESAIQEISVIRDIRSGIKKKKGISWSSSIIQENIVESE